MIRRRRFALQVAVCLAPMLLALTGAGSASAASGGWTITGSPSSIQEGVATAISFKATNISGGSSVGCVQLTVPSAFDVSGVAVDTVPAGLSWTADAPSSSGTSTLVRVHGVTEADIIKKDGQSIDFRVVATGTGVGSYTWPAESRDHANCTSGIDSASVTVAIVAASLTPTPPPTPGPMPAPTPTSQPAPTPKPAPTATPRPTPTPTAQPATPTPAQSNATPPTSTPTAPRLGGPGGSTGGSGTSTGQGGSTPNSGTTTDRYRIGPSQPDNGLNPSIVTSALGFGGVLAWTIPSLALTVPGLLLLLVILAQIGGAAAWLPVVRRKVGGFGFRSRGRAKVR